MPNEGKIKKNEAQKIAWVLTIPYMDKYVRYVLECDIVN